jgi:histidinol-phosphate/aromatic aminotransferase/cobyric acid decarboxylase-like protein
LERFKKLIRDSSVDNLILINPNNPNGGYIEFDELEKFIEEVYDYLSYIILDESFIHFVKEGEVPNLYELFYKFPKKVIIVKSMSKDFGIAGLRLGYAICDATIIERMLSSGFLWNISGVGEYFLRLLAFDENFKKEYENQRKYYVRITRKFFDELSNYLCTYPSRANFVLAKVPIDADLFVFLLLVRYGIYLRSASDKIGLYGNYVRISARTEEENKLIVEGIKNLLKDLKI